MAYLNQPYYAPLFNCDHCEYVFTGQAELAAHIALEHMPFTCQHCNRHFTSRRGLATHSRVHGRGRRGNRNQEYAELPFRCHACPRTFATERGRDMHFWRAVRLGQHRLQDHQ